MTVLEALAARVADGLADLAARPERAAVVIPGERGDRIVVDLRDFPLHHDDVTTFFVDVGLCPVPWVAWLHEISFAQARERVPDEADGMVRDRLTGPGMGGYWDIRGRDLGPAVRDLLPALRIALDGRFLPLLPREALRARIRSGDLYPAAGVYGDPRVTQMLCVLEDMPDGDRAQLVEYFRRCAAVGDLDLGRLADWLDSDPAGAGSGTGAVRPAPDGAVAADRQEDG
ncbi:hypothetical protein [Micromonospora sp. NPDC093277]|uniref:hypothetical protein n=1 Tax=Micromonospora sp. NPDC093277 TaxID=3364291 RepID=UPI00380BB8F8